MPFNFLVVIGAAFIPLIIGFIWYNPKVFGNAWMQATGLRMEDGKGMNMPVIFGVSLLVSFLMAVGMLPIVIHQWGLNSSLMGEPGYGDATSEVGTYLSNYMAKYGHTFRTFGHGALHGVLTSLFLIMPAITTSSMYERRGFKYIAIATGYWMVSLALMGGVICAFA